MEQVEEFVTFLASIELQAFIDENGTCPIANRFEREITFILEYCKMNFSQNIYVVNYNEKLRGKLARESTDVLQVEEDKDLSMGCPCNPKKLKMMNNQRMKKRNFHLHHPWMRVTLKLKLFLLMKLITLMIDFAFMILVMRRNINLCLMRTILITV
jgi:hypothetical protein